MVGNAPRIMAAATAMAIMKSGGSTTIDIYNHDIVHAKAALEAADKIEPTIAGMQASISAWQAKAFPGSSPISILLHMREEIEELAIAATRDVYFPDEIAEECADILHLLYALCAKFDLSLADAVVDKFKVNQQKRRFAYDPAIGYAKHVEEV